MFSYGSLVAFNHRGQSFRTGRQSQTTSRHIIQALGQKGEWMDEEAFGKQFAQALKIEVDAFEG